MVDAENKKEKERTGPMRREMPFLEHLEELRGVLLQSLIVVSLLAVGAWFISKPAVEILTRPAGELVFLGPTEAFTLRLKVALFIGFFVALPFVLFKVWSFIAPGLFDKEKKMLSLVVLVSTLLFLVGALFAFFVMIPFALTFLLGFGTETLRPMISAGNYFGFVTKLVIAFGIVFQLPLVVSMLTWAGIVKPDWLFRNWKFALVIIAASSAVLTPPDIASQMLMALPVTMLYFLSAFLSLAIAKRKRESEEASAEEDENGDEEERAGEKEADR